MSKADVDNEHAIPCPLFPHFFEFFKKVDGVREMGILFSCFRPYGSSAATDSITSEAIGNPP
jgi:hypothetical protein